MTNKEAIARIKDHKIVHKMNEPRAIYISEALDMAIEALEREEIVIKKIPKGYHYDTETREFLVYRNYTGDEIHIEKPTPLYRLEQDLIAQERYEDLCEYFGDAKDILNSREDFKAWLGRVKWHIYKAEELYEIIKSLIEIIEIWKGRKTQESKTGHWIYDDEHSDWFDLTYECSCCKRKISVPYGLRNEVYKEYPYCHCGAKMIERREK